MTKQLDFPNGQIHKDLLLEETDKGLATVLNEHPEIKTLWERRQLYPKPLTINGVNPVLHVMIEGIIENQLQDLTGVQEIYTKLQQEENLTPHAARACIANVFIHEFFKVLAEKTPFDEESFIRRLSLIGTDISSLGRNDRCPCGSGAKFKRCCSSYADAFMVSPLAGRIDLGHGSYFFETPNSGDPLDPIFQLEARYQIAMYMDEQEDLDGAVKVLKENIAQAESYDGGTFLANAWQDYMSFCQNYRQLTGEFVEASDHLLAMTSDEEKRATIIYDKADYFAQNGDMKAAEAEYTSLFSSMPNNYHSRYRFALMLSRHDRYADAIKVLTDLLKMKDIDDQTQEDALFLLETLGEDTTDFNPLF